MYRTYFSLPVEMLFDKDSKPIPATRKDVMDGSKNVVAAITFLMLFCSILSPYNYVPFGKTNAGDFNEQIVITDYFNARHLGNCFAIACKCYVVRSFRLGIICIRCMTQLNCVPFYYCSILPAGTCVGRLSIWKCCATNVWVQSSKEYEKSYDGGNIT